LLSASLIWRAIWRHPAQSIVQTFFEGDGLKNRLISAEQLEMAPGETGGLGARNVGAKPLPMDVFEPLRA
jgi:hypothetical protein